MALLWLDAFENVSGEMPLKYNSGSGGSSGSSGTRTGAGYAQTLSTQNLAKTLAPGSNTVILGVAVRVSSAPSSVQTFLRIREGATTHLELRYDNATREIDLYNGDGTLLASGTTVLPTSGTDVTDWRYIELKATIHDTTGAYELRIDDVVEYSATGVDTQNGGTAAWDTVVLGRTSGASGTFHFDDYYVCDDTGSELNNFQTSAARVDRLTPNADGDLIEWTPNASTNVSRVNQTGNNNGDSGYNTTDTVGHIDRFALSDLPVSPDAIKAVMPVMIARKDDAGVNEVSLKVRSNGTLGAGSAHTLTSSYAAYVGDIVTADPDTTGGWTEAAINDLEVQYERVT